MNFAPELGVLETRGLLTLLRQRGLDEAAREFVDLAVQSKKWEKWVVGFENPPKDEQKALICGHYLFGDEACQEIKAQLGPEIDGTLRSLIERRICAYALPAKQDPFFAWTPGHPRELPLETRSL